MRNTQLLIMLCLGCLVLFATGLLLPWWFIDQPNNFGDTAGAVNGLFSALGFVGVIYALVLHRHEMRLHRFEQHFFHLMQQRQALADHLDLTDDERLEHLCSLGQCDNCGGGSLPLPVERYLRHLYCLIHYVATASYLSPHERRGYMEQLSCHLSTHELVWLYYTGLSDLAHPNLKGYIEDYSLLKHLRTEMLPDDAKPERMYKPSAFEK